MRTPDVDSSRAPGQASVATDSGCEMADLFRIRVAGVSFDILTALGTPASAAAARALVAAQKDVETLCPTAIHNAVQ